MKHPEIEALGRLSYGLYVLTSFHGDEMNGMIASWVSQISHAPFLIMAAVHPHRYTHHLIEQSGYFALHILSKDQKDFLQRFKGPDPGAKFEGLAWQKGETGCPVFEECIACLECAVKKTLSPGNHTLFIGEVQCARMKRKSEIPLTSLDYNGFYLGRD